MNAKIWGAIAVALVLGACGAKKEEAAAELLLLRMPLLAAAERRRCRCCCRGRAVDADRTRALPLPTLLLTPTPLPDAADAAAEPRRSRAAVAVSNYCIGLNGRVDGAAQPATSPGRSLSGTRMPITIREAKHPGPTATGSKTLTASTSPT